LTEEKLERYFNELEKFVDKSLKYLSSFVEIFLSST